MEGTHLPRVLTRACSIVTDALIRYSVRAHFRAVYARVRATPDARRPAVVFANHHYWWDGYLCYLLGKTWRQPMNLWMEEWRWLPPFWALGALPYPEDNLMRRARTLRHTVRLLRQPPRVLFLFPEGSIHAGWQLLPFGRSLYWLARQVPELQLLPMAIVVSPTLHQYPRAYLHVDYAFECDAVSEVEWLQQASHRISTLVTTLREEAECYDTPEKAAQGGFFLLAKGKSSVHERWWARIIP